MADKFRNIFLMAGFLLFTAKVAATQDTYRAAVVEFGVSFISDIPTYFERNILRYTQLIADAAGENVDIVVFPESTLNYAFTSNRSEIANHAFEVPDPEQAISPCDMEDYHPMLAAISCAARSGHLYVVINVSEKLSCDEDTQPEMGDDRACHQDGLYLFNSNVVFNRFGVIISRYRKTHLFGEFAFNTTARPEVQTFSTDFGVKFGHLICFDLQYYTPAQLLAVDGVDNFVLPLMWYSELPFLTAVQYEAAWAHSHAANLLAAGASSPLSGSGGSGLFAGTSGARAALVSGETTTRLLVSDLFKKPAEGSFSDHGVVEIVNPRRMNLLRDHLHLYTISFLEPEKFIAGGAEQICYLDFCCDFNITTSFYGNSTEPPSGPHYSYALVAFRGVRTYSGVANGGVENCGLVACTSTEEQDCGQRFLSSTEYSPYITIEKVTLNGEFTLTKSAQFPVTLTGDMAPLSTDNFSYDISVIKDKRILTLDLKNVQSDLLTFGIFGRVFSMDCDPLTETRENKYDRVLKIDSNEDCLFSMSSGDDADLWCKLSIPILLIAVYFLEMM